MKPSTLTLLLLDICLIAHVVRMWLNSGRTLVRRHQALWASAPSSMRKVLRNTSAHAASWQSERLRCLQEYITLSAKVAA